MCRTEWTVHDIPHHLHRPWQVRIHRVFRETNRSAPFFFFFFQLIEMDAMVIRAGTIRHPTREAGDIISGSGACMKKPILYLNQSPTIAMLT